MAAKKKPTGVRRSSPRQRRVRELLAAVSVVPFLSAPRLVIFAAEGSMPYAAPWEWVPGALRTVLGIELPAVVSSEVGRILSVGRLPVVVLLDGELEVHEGAHDEQSKGKA